MGFDIIGNNGDYFPVGKKWWGELVGFACEVAPDITKACKCWTTNDWDGLDAVRRRALARALQAQVDGGGIEKYVRGVELTYTPRDEFDEPPQPQTLTREEMERYFAAMLKDEVVRFIGFLEGSNGFVIG
jgi:hypothetical protein